jgi:hypothetical protein
MTQRVVLGWLSVSLLIGFVACQSYPALEKGALTSFPENEATATGNSYEAGTIIMFFYIINETGSDIQVRVLADGVELFLQGIGSQVPSLPGKEVPPLPTPYPAVELKVSMSKDAQQLEVQELLHLGTRATQATFNIAGFSQAPGGFRITIRKDGILLDQDYRPIR